MLNCSLGIMAYNEEKNIGKAIESALDQKIISGILQEIIIVASGCSDNTIPIVKEKYLSRDKRIKLLIQEKRMGKASAINTFLETAKSEILIVQGADLIPQENAFEFLVRPFLDPKVGMTGAHPVPINETDKFMGFVVHFQWRMHHLLNQNHVKLGELIAFRNAIKKITEHTAVDEIILETLIKKQGFKLVYAPESIVLNKGPETVKDFLKQRRRIFAGHLHVKRDFGYEASSMNPLEIFKLAFNEFLNDKKHFVWILGAIFLEIWGRLLGAYDFYVKKKIPVIWDMVESTKNLEEKNINK